MFPGTTFPDDYRSYLVFSIERKWYNPLRYILGRKKEIKEESILTRDE